MAENTKTVYEVITLTPGQKNRVHVVDEQRKRLVLTMQQAIRACHAFESQLQFQDQFETLLSYLGEWWQDRSGKVDRAMVTVRDTGLLFVVVQRGIALDTDLEFDITALVADIINDGRFNLIRLEAIALPACEPDGVASFVNPNSTVELEISREELAKNAN